MATPQQPQLSLPLNTTTLSAAALTLAVLYLTLSRPTRFVQWLGKKRYQYEITFSLYMLTPTEKFIANSILFLLLSMVLLACSLYLPEHITTISRRVFYYLAGDGPESGAAVTMAARHTKETLKASFRPAVDAAREAGSGFS